MNTHDVALVGLGVMGANLLRNLERNGFSGVGYDVNRETVQKFLAGPAKGKRIVAAKGWKDLARRLSRPRKVFILVPAGRPVEAVITSLRGVLERGDVIVECGNSHYRDTERREAACAAKGLHFTGMGVSGGEEGALLGPSMMPGGPRAGYDNLAPQLEKIAAQTDDGPCVTYIGPGGAGHYVKMVHNGIEYGDMQLIAEAYDLLRRVGGLSNAELADVFDEWNRGELESFLIEITARIFRQHDEHGAGMLVEQIKDSASMKGTGTWTVQDALELGAPIPTIAAAVDARLLSAMRDERLAAGDLPAPPTPAGAGDQRAWIDAVRAALYCSKTCAYAQGMAMLGRASAARDWALPLSEIARIWKAGCIIRARFLHSIQEAFARDPALPNLLRDPFFREALGTRQGAWRQVVATGLAAGVPLPERLDRPGIFHTHWD